jgi:hypothetical protein
LPPQLQHPPAINGHVGCWKQGASWRAEISIRGVKQRLGTVFDTVEQAAEAYDRKCVELGEDPPNAAFLASASVTSSWPVERITAHRGRGKAREMRVQWEGWDGEDSWEPEANVQHCDAYAIYMNSDAVVDRAKEKAIFSLLSGQNGGGASHRDPHKCPMCQALFPRRNLARRHLENKSSDCWRKLPMMTDSDSDSDSNSDVDAHEHDDEPERKHEPEHEHAQPELGAATSCVTKKAPSRKQKRGSSQPVTSQPVTSTDHRVVVSTCESVVVPDQTSEGRRKRLKTAARDVAELGGLVPCQSGNGGSKFAAASAARIADVTSGLADFASGIVDVTSGMADLTSGIADVTSGIADAMLDAFLDDLAGIVEGPSLTPQTARGVVASLLHDAVETPAVEPSQALGSAVAAVATAAVGTKKPRKSGRAPGSKAKKQRRNKGGGGSGGGGGGGGASEAPLPQTDPPNSSPNPHVKDCRRCYGGAHVPHTCTRKKRAKKLVSVGCRACRGSHRAHTCGIEPCSSTSPLDQGEESMAKPCRTAPKRQNVLAENKKKPRRAPLAHTL